MDTMVSADEARDMLDGETRGVHGCSLADATRVGRDILSNAVVYGGSPPALRRACDMLDDVERLARTVVAQAEIIAGRTTAPTFAERVAHMESHRDNRWMARAAAGAVVIGDFDDLPMQAALTTLVPVRWWPLDADGRPCAWPVTP